MILKDFISLAKVLVNDISLVDIGPCLLFMAKRLFYIVKKVDSEPFIERSVYSGLLQFSRLQLIKCWDKF